MGIYFELHRFNEARYERLLPVLRALAEGRADAALPDIARECLATSETDEFRMLNADNERDRDWPPICGDVSTRPGTR